jgi:hypothetical protein
LVNKWHRAKVDTHFSVFHAKCGKQRGLLQPKPNQKEQRQAMVSQREKRIANRGPTVAGSSKATPKFTPFLLHTQTVHSKLVAGD